MSTLRNAFSAVKNFVVNFVEKRNEENPNEEDYQPSVSRFARGIFTNSGRKRPAQSVYEPEITDDEDDSPTFPYFHCQSQNPCAKRIRVESDSEFEMASKRGSQQSTSRNFSTGEPGIANVEGSLRMKVSDRINRTEINKCNEPGPSTAKGKNTRNIPIVLDKIIETITLDDDDPRPSTSSNSCVPRRSMGSSLFGRDDSAIKKPRISTPMKAKQRDGNRFSKCLSDINKKIEQNFHAVRHREMSQYKQLLMRYNILSNTGTYQTPALTKSIVGKQQLQVMYSKFGRSPTKGSVTLCFDGKALPNEDKSLLSAADRLALVPVPRLFSTPQGPEPETSTSGLKALTYKNEPEIIDLAEEPPSTKEIEACISPITPVTPRRSYTSSTPVNTSQVGNFTNLEDALNNSVLPDESFAKDEAAEASSALAIEESQKDDDEVSILAEKIVNKSRSKSINTLALEQTLCPYVDQRWLDESKSSWRERQEHRKKRISEESETLNILRRESTLEKDLEERIRKKLTLTEIIVLEEPPEELPELTDEILAIIEHAKARGNDGEVLAQVRLPKDTISITRGDIRTLGPSQWLNDNVINTYMGLIVLRSKEGKYPSVYAFQTFFYPKLLKEGYSNSLKRWTRKDDIFAHDLIILPIHLGLHWCLACIDFRKKTIRYYDSLGGDNYKCLNVLLDYISREMKERKQMDLDKSEWALENVKGIPQQQNGSDCGMFSCKFAEYLSRDATFTFKQTDMPYYRDRMIYELIKADLLHP